MSKSWQQWVLSPLVLIAASLYAGPSLWADVSVFPEVSLYLTHNNIFRSRMAAGVSWSDNQSQVTNGSFEYDLDIGLKSFFRRYVFKDPNAEKSKRISLRLGFAYFPSFTEGDSSLNEKRGLGEITFRFPLGNAWLLSDRNRGELRWVGDSQSARYRNRLRLERNVAIKRFRLTPYANGEVYYDGKVDEWNRVDGTLGAEFPWYYSTILEFYFTWQFQHQSSDNQTVGLALQKHL